MRSSSGDGGGGDQRGDRVPAEGLCAIAVRVRGDDGKEVEEVVRLVLKGGRGE